MSENSKIEWTDHTFNPWIGCTKVSTGCKHCYAETLATNRMGLDVWGPNATRKVTKTPWQDVRNWNRKAAKAGRRDKVFCASLCDVFEDHPVANATRPMVWDVVHECEHLDFQMLTKRPENIVGMVPNGWGAGWPNVWLGASVEDQATADARIPHLLSTPAAIRFISYEPALGPVDWGMPADHRGHEKDFITGTPWPQCLDCSTEDEIVDWTQPDGPQIDWLICGGESGPGARPMHPDWARAARDACQAAGVAFFFKQWGEWAPVPAGSMSDAVFRRGPGHGGHVWRVGKKRAGRLLDGVEHNEYPASPQVAAAFVEAAGDI